VLVVIVVIGIIGYVVTGFAYAATRISTADKTLNTVVAHENNVVATMQDFNKVFGALGATSTPQQARDAVDQFVSGAQAAGKTVEEDDATLAVESARLSDHPWFTTVSRANLDKESARIGHARKALASARTLLSNYLLVGQFRHAYLDAEIDFDALVAANASADLAGAKTILGTMKAHVDKALQLSTAPSLPPEVHDMMVDFQKFVDDFSSLIAAAQANDAGAIAAYSKNLSDDANKLGSYSSADINAKIAAFNKPLIDGYNLEMAAATL
jgi:hypothetical protein